MTKENLAKSLESSLEKLRQTDEIKRLETQITIRNLTREIVTRFCPPRYKSTPVIELEVSQRPVKVWLKKVEETYQGGSYDEYQLIMDLLPTRSPIKNGHKLFQVSNIRAITNHKGEPASIEELEDYQKILTEMNDYYFKEQTAVKA